MEWAPHEDLITEGEENMEQVPTNTVSLNNHALDKDAEILLRTSQVLAKFASTLVLQPVKTSIVSRTGSQHGATAPAWSNADTIFLNSSHLTNLGDVDNIIALRGLGLHESAHIMFTPGVDSKHMKDVIKQDLWRASNILEDARIEMNLNAMFSNVDDWLTALVARHALALPQEQLQYQLPLVWGRKYLDPEVRKFFYDIYPDVANRDELCSLIDQYLAINVSDPKNSKQVMPIIHRFNELIASGLQTVPEEDITLPDPTSPTGERTFKKPGSNDGWSRINDGDHGAMHGEIEREGEGKAKAMSPQQQQKLTDKINKMMSADKGKLAQAQGNAPQASPGQGNPGQGDVDSAKNTDPVAGEGDEVGGSGVGKNNASYIEDWANKVKERIVNEQAKVIDTLRKQIHGEVELDGHTVKPPMRPHNETYQASQAAVNAVKSFARELEQLKADHDPAWERKVDQGKLNVQRYGTGCEVDEAFDQWDMGREDAVDIECVIALDTSGSMGWTMSAAFQYMWAIKRALDKVGASTTVVGFDHTTKLLYSADERATNLYKSTGMGGSTNPLKAIEYAKSVLGNSQRAIKVFIPITDGMWDNATECDNIIRLMRKGGVVTALALIDENIKPGQQVDSHGCEVAVAVTDASHLYLLARNMVRAGINRNLSR
jgi:hypothetical protein